jgi:hypothetical protein
MNIHDRDTCISSRDIEEMYWHEFYQKLIKIPLLALKRNDVNNYFKNNPRLSLDHFAELYQDLRDNGILYDYSYNYLLNPNIINYSFLKNNYNNDSNYNDILYYKNNKNHDGILVCIYVNDIKFDFSDHLLSMNPTITPQIVKEMPRYNWNIIGFMQNPNFTLDDLYDPQIQEILQNNKQYSQYTVPEFSNYFFMNISTNPHLTRDYIIDKIRAGLSFSPRKLWANQCINYETYCEIVQILRAESLKEDKNMSTRELENVRRKYASSNPQILTLARYLVCNRAEWSIAGLSRNPNITIEDVRNYPELKWCPNHLVQNPSILPADVIEMYRGGCFAINDQCCKKCYYLSMNIHNNCNFVLKMLFKLSLDNPNITMEYIQWGFSLFSALLAINLYYNRETIPEKYYYITRDDIQRLTINPMTRERGEYIVQMKEELVGDLINEFCGMYHMQDLREDIMKYL